MTARLDKDLGDDMLKLVRYKVLFVRREYEVAFSEHEDLVSDNMTGNSFVGLKIAEFIQDVEAGKIPIPSKWFSRHYPPGLTNGDFLTGIPHGDKKYLRVYYEVMERYPREKFKHEEQQIRVLEEIRDVIGGSGSASGPSGPYVDLLKQLQFNAQLFNSWRQEFRPCAAGIAPQLSALFGQFKDLGTFQTPEITAEEIERALSNPPASSRETLDSFAGSGDSILQVFVRKDGMPPADADVPPNHQMRGPVLQSTQPGISYLQKITESYVQPVDPEDAASLQKALAANQVDLHVHAFSDQSGLVSWSSLNQGGLVRMRAIAYPLEGKILLFKQMLNPDLTPFAGPMPQAQFVDVIPDQFVVAVDFAVQDAGKKSVCTCAMPINFDFSKCSAAFLGLILKFRRDGTG